MTRKQINREIMDHALELDHIWKLLDHVWEAADEHPEQFEGLATFDISAAQDLIGRLIDGDY